MKVVVESSRGRREQVAHAMDQSLSSTEHLGGIPHTLTAVAEKALSPNVSLCGAPAVISFRRDLHDMNINF